MSVFDAYAENLKTEEDEEEIKNPVLRVLRATKLVSVLLMFITAKAAFDLSMGLGTGTISTILFLPIGPINLAVTVGMNLVILIYVMVFGWFFTNALIRVFNGYWSYFDSTVWSRIKAHYLAKETKQE